MVGFHSREKEEKKKREKKEKKVRREREWPATSKGDGAHNMSPFLIERLTDMTDVT